MAGVVGGAGAAAQVEPGLIQDILDNNAGNVRQRLMNDEDPEQQANDGTYGIEHAIIQNNADIVHLLLAYGLKIRSFTYDDGQTLLHLAVSQRGINPRIIQDICQAAKDVVFVHKANIHGQTAYHFAAIFQNPQMLIYLGEEGGVGPYALDHHKQSPLFLAAGSGNLANTQYLLNIGGGMLEVRDSEGRTPLYVAAESGFLDVVEFLIQNGADINARANNDLTPLEVAQENGNDDVAHILLEAGANIVSLIHRMRPPVQLAPPLLQNVGFTRQSLARSAYNRRRAAVSAWARARTKEEEADRAAAAASAANDAAAAPAANAAAAAPAANAAPAPPPPAAEPPARVGLPRENAEHPNMAGRILRLARENATHPNIPGRRNQRRKTMRKRHARRRHTRRN